MIEYQSGDLARLLADAPPHDPGTNLISTVMPQDQANEMEDDVHALFIVGCMSHQAAPPPDWAERVVCSVTQAAYLLGRRHGAEDAFRAADQLANLDPRQFEGGSGLGQ
jgi:hypothetical protein